MPEVICNTSPIQYLHQLGLLHLLPALVQRVIVPPAVVEELAVGRNVRCEPARSLTDLGAGETEVLMLALESREAVVIIDDALARRVAGLLGLRLAGTLGLLLDAKRAGLIPTIAPRLDELQALRFRVAPHTRTAVLKLAGELP